MDDLKLQSRREKGLDSLLQTVRVFSKDTGMEIGTEKCAILSSYYKERKSHKYVGILAADKVLEEKMKLNVSKEYIRLSKVQKNLRKFKKRKVKKSQVKKSFKSKLNGGNSVRGVNAWAVSPLRYSATTVSWKKSELQVIDRKTRNCLTYMEH